MMDYDKYIRAFKYSLPCSYCNVSLEANTEAYWKRRIAKTKAGRIYHHECTQLGIKSYKEEQQKQEEIDILWDAIVCQSSSYEANMGNLTEEIHHFKEAYEPTFSGGSNDPTKSIFKENGMTEREELVARLARLDEIEEAKKNNSPQGMTLLEAESVQQLGDKITSQGLNEFDNEVKRLYPNNNVASMCVMPWITPSQAIIAGSGVWMQVGGEKKPITDPKLPVCRAEKGVWKIIGMKPGEENSSNFGLYQQITDQENSQFSDTHCYCCATPIYDGITAVDGRPKHWTTNGTMTEYQLCRRWQDFAGPHNLGKMTKGTNPRPIEGAGYFKGTMQEFVEESKRTHPLTGNITPTVITPTSPPVTLAEAENFDDNSDLPPEIGNF